MARLPNVGSDLDAWGDILNEYLLVAHNADGTQKESGLPPGALVPYAGASAPTGFLLCDGSAVSRTTYAALYGVIGATYGAGDGSTTFNLPDLRGRVPVGIALSGGHAEVSSLGANDGASLANRRPKHGTGFFGTTGGGGGPGPNPTFIASGVTGAVQNYLQADYPLSGNAGMTGLPAGPVNQPSYIVVNFIIKT